MGASAALNAAGKIPWKKLVALIPGIVTAADKLSDYWGSKRKLEPVDQTASTSSQISAILIRITALEDNEKNQAKMISEIAYQLEAISTGLKETANRLVLVFWLAIVALASSIITVYLVAFN